MDLRVGLKIGKYNLVYLKRDLMTNLTVQVYQDDLCSVEWSGSVPTEQQLDDKRNFSGN